MAKKKVFRRYKTKKKGGQHYWKGRKGIAKSINRMHPTISERDSSHLVDMTFDGVRSNLKREGRYSQPGFGTFRLQHRKARPARVGISPLTGETMKMKARPSMKVVKFRPSKEMKREFM